VLLFFTITVSTVLIQSVFVNFMGMILNLKDVPGDFIFNLITGILSPSHLLSGSSLFSLCRQEKGRF
jgi:hypothetical protein